MFLGGFVPSRVRLGREKSLFTGLHETLPVACSPSADGAFELDYLSTMPYIYRSRQRDTQGNPQYSSDNHDYTTESRTTTQHGRQLNRGAKSQRCSVNEASNNRLQG